MRSSLPVNTDVPSMENELISKVVLVRYNNMIRTTQRLKTKIERRTNVPILEPVKVRVLTVVIPEASKVPLFVI